jgi:hypothetical protein
MLFKEIIVVFSQNRAKNKYKIQNYWLVIGGTYNYHLYYHACFLKIVDYEAPNDIVFSRVLLLPVS